MFYVVLRQLLLVIVIFNVKGTTVTKFLDYTHYSCLKDFKCEFPQPRSVLVIEEYKKFLEAKGIKDVQVDNVIPNMIVLHRCDEGSGCCRQGQVCKVAKSDSFNVTVFANHIGSKFSKHQFETTNHTQCSCQNAYNTIK